MNVDYTVVYCQTESDVAAQTQNGHLLYSWYCCAVFAMATTDLIRKLGMLWYNFTLCRYYHIVSCCEMLPALILLRLLPSLSHTHTHTLKQLKQQQPRYVPQFSLFLISVSL